MSYSRPGRPKYEYSARRDPHHVMSAWAPQALAELLLFIAFPRQVESGCVAVDPLTCDWTISAHTPYQEKARYGTDVIGCVLGGGWPSRGMGNLDAMTWAEPTTRQGPPPCLFSPYVELGTGLQSTQLAD